MATRPIGVDVQRLPSAVAVALPALHPDERAELLARPPRAARQALFGRLRTHKEAYLKGLGTGCTAPSADHLGVGPALHPGGWTVAGIPCDPGRAASAAVRGAPPATAQVHRRPESRLTAAEQPFPITAGVPMARRTSPTTAPAGPEAAA
ncbi:hypothetical protein ABZW30_16275 [Kitasatospora sp. NPDC004669]|uniref:hypothetical protein n=1 Tax=Kitasatospora sp. NPDC004669 TaxID=3154555 RepID=UPI0033BCD534